LKKRRRRKEMDDYRIGQSVRVASEENPGKVVGFVGDQVLVRFADGYTEKFYPHELFYDEG